MVARELTKIHEEIIRGPLPDLVTQVKERNNLRGEIIILVEGRKKDAPVFDVAVIKSILQETMQHQSLRDAVQIVAQTTKMPRREIYQIALEMKILRDAK